MNFYIQFVLLLSITCIGIAPPPLMPPLKLYHILDTPTDAAIQTVGKKYIQDYEVTDTVVLSNKITMRLRRALLDKNNYTQLHFKKCPFKAHYGVEIDSNVIGVISLQPCSKIILSVDKGLSVNHLDLVKDNSIEVYLKNIR
jgi:hypothetical protein